MLKHEFAQESGVIQLFEDTQSLSQFKNKLDKLSKALPVKDPIKWGRNVEMQDNINKIKGDGFELFCELLVLLMGSHPHIGLTDYKPTDPATSMKVIRELANKESANHDLVRSAERQAELGEVFTPTNLVLDMLKKLPKGKVNGVWVEGKTFLDPACGNGQFLAVILIMKKQLGHKNPLDTVFGVDIMQDNVDECRARLLKIAGNNKRNRRIVEQNIVCADGLTYDYSFGRDE